jgi:hypothetical protein
MLIHRERKIITPVSGNGSINTHRINGGILYQLCSYSTTTTNIYDINLVDEEGDTICKREAIEGELIEHPVDLPLKGIYTIKIVDAVIDESIVVKLVVEE